MTAEPWNDPFAGLPHPVELEERRGGSGLEFATLADLGARVDARGPRRWLIRGIWPAGAYGVHGAEPKAGKTWNAFDLAVSVASGTPWLGTIPIDDPGPVVVFAGEGGDGNIVRRLRAIADARGLVADDLDIVICTRAPHLSSDEHIRATSDALHEHRPRLVIVDPLYLAARGANGADLYAMGAVLERVQRLCEHHDASLLVVTHFNRSRDLKGAARFTGAGPAEWGRVLIAAGVISRHTDPTTLGTTVVTELEITGGEVPDQALRLKRTITADDPDNLDSPLRYATTLGRADAPIDPEHTDLKPAAAKLLQALHAVAKPDQPRSWSALVDSVVATHGHGLSRETCSRELNLLADAGLADCIDDGPGRPKLWWATVVPNPKDPDDYL